MNFDSLANTYTLTHQKADKKYVMLPTARRMLGSLNDKIVVDVGCGDGFFTEEFAKTADFVHGVDKSKEMLSRTRPAKNIQYTCEDMMHFEFPLSNVVFAPFVLNYLNEKSDLQRLVSNISDSLSHDGLFGSIVDMPTKLFTNGRKFGYVKKIDELVDGKPIKINLYADKLVSSFTSYYYSKESLGNICRTAGFSDFIFVEPMVSTKGLNKKGREFWDEYLQYPGIAFFVAKK